MFIWSGGEIGDPWPRVAPAHDEWPRTLIGDLPLQTGGSPSPAASWIKIVLGVSMLAMAARQWRNRPKEGEAPRLPGWMTSIDKVTPTWGLMLGVVLSAVNPKNPMLCAAARGSRSRAWLAANSATVMSVLLLVIGVVLAGKGIGGL